jgi:ABC-type Zn2+ transport system substrate-binding protein/surface adhesin
MGHKNPLSRALDPVHGEHHDHGHGDHDHGHLHDHTHNANLMILATFVGGMLLIVAFIGQFIFVDQPDRANYLAMAAAIILGLPLVIEALGDLDQGSG